MRTDYLKPMYFGYLLTALMPENRLALRLSMATGLRIGDVLALPAAKLRQGQRFTVKEQKTGKAKRVYIPAELYEEAVAFSGRYYVFEGRNDPRKHRTRQAVFKDLKRVSKIYRVNGAKLRANIAPHSARKIYAVEAFKQYGDVSKVQQLLNHSNEAVTLIYVMAEELAERQAKRKGRA